MCKYMFVCEQCNCVNVHMHIWHICEHVQVETEKQPLVAASETLPTSLRTRTLDLEFIS